MTVSVTQFVRRSGPHHFSLERLYEDIRGELGEEFRVSVWTCRNFSRGFWPRVEDLLRARKAQSNVNHVTGDVHYLTYLLDPRRTVLTILDLVGLERLSGFRRFVFWFFWYWVPVKLSRAVVVISESTRRQLIANVRCCPSKVRVIHCNVSEDFKRTPRIFTLDSPRILQVGTTPNKNIERVAEALSGMSVRLVIVGPLSTVQRDCLASYNIDFENHTNLSRDALRMQYEASDLLLFASTYEGFGLPIVEAQAVGRPVVTSNILSMPEVAGEAACFIDPLDPSSIRAGVLRVINDAEYRNWLIMMGHENVARFQPDLVAEAYAKLYREIAGKADEPT